MSRHSKAAGKPLMVRISPEQRTRLKRAAAVETQRRGETVDLSQLLRELAMAAVDRILAADEQTDRREGPEERRRAPAFTDDSR